VQIRTRVTHGADIAERLGVALKVVDFEALVEIFRGAPMGEIFDDVLEEDLAEDFFEGLLLEFLGLSGDESNFVNGFRERTGKTLGRKKKNE
jgi:hypothetical protein